MAQYRKKARPGQESGLVKSLAVTGIVALLGAVGAGFWWVQQERAERDRIDSETLCPKDGPTAITAVLVDRTDSLNEIQAEALARLIRNWAEDVPKDGAFHVYEVGRGGRLLAPVVAVCNPGTGDEESALVANKKMLRARYEAKYSKPVEAMIDAMRQDSQANTSPIMEGIQAIAVEDFGPERTKRLEVKRLYIVSDLLQNGSGFNAYASVPKLADFLKSSAGHSLAAPLDGVKTWLYVVNRNSPKQTGALLEFWLDWLATQGADVQEKRNVPG
jgi:hypothetical protein